MFTRIQAVPISLQRESSPTRKIIWHVKKRVACEGGIGGLGAMNRIFCAKYCGSYIDCAADRTYEYKAKICMAITLKSR